MVLESSCWEVGRWLDDINDYVGNRIQTSHSGPGENASAPFWMWGACGARFPRLLTLPETRAQSSIPFYLDRKIDHGWNSVKSDPAVLSRQLTGGTLFKTVKTAFHHPPISAPSCLLLPSFPQFWGPLLYTSSNDQISIPYSFPHSLLLNPTLISIHHQLGI